MAVWWTRKEAVLKATGDGLTVAPDRVHVSDPSRPAALLGWDHPTGPGPAPGPGAAPPPLALHDLAPGPGYVACLAVFSTRPVEVQEADGDALLAAVRTPGTCR